MFNTFKDVYASNTALLGACGLALGRCRRGMPKTGASIAHATTHATSPCISSKSRPAVRPQAPMAGAPSHAAMTVGGMADGLGPGMTTAPMMGRATVEARGAATSTATEKV